MGSGTTLSSDNAAIGQDVPTPMIPQNGPEGVADKHDVTTTSATETDLCTVSSDPAVESQTPQLDDQEPAIVFQTIEEGTKSTTEANIDAAIANGENAEAGYQSSDLELSSDNEDDDSSSSSESSEDESDEAPEQEKQKVVPMEDEEEGFTSNDILRTVHEITEFHIERPTCEISSETALVPVGEIFRVIDKVIVVQSYGANDRPVLDMGSLFVYDDREIMGEVFETFGPIVRPFYSVRYNSSDEIDAKRAVIGAKVYYVPSYQKTQIVEVEKLKMMKGTDASNIYDEEPDEDELEFSDDEAEMEYKKSRKRKIREGACERGKGTRKRNKPASADDDFGAALAAYENSDSTCPPRQIQSYADISEGQYPQPQPQRFQRPAYNYPDRPIQHNHEGNPPYKPSQQQHENRNHPTNSRYQTPAELVSALVNSFGGNLPSHSEIAHVQESSLSSPSSSSPAPAPASAFARARQSIRALFAKPPPPSTSEGE
ncbi:hypothetical protein EC973_004348 [Apophysomyces ossiformis]|uniref:H/ACA ribonucleoprotein complex non-core subunit NAF1 n=1 Tax=Apophysomyces ossiformis TaxID=679940 RepID=A0A8H7BIC5_9FUNG|nr:hypothetical protein EC973_004348 [Apophysomyces ossiformis]